MSSLSESFIRAHGVRLAVVGRPNVGKSTLFNRLCGKKMAIVDDQPGVTRDWREGFGQLSDIPLILIDTAGLDGEEDTDLLKGMKAQATSALNSADVVLFLFDARDGINPQDDELARWVRQFKKPVILVGNKCEGQAGLTGMAESYALGFGDPIALSAEHGLGLGELYDALETHYEAPAESEDEDKDEDPALQLAIVGRPNVGKSTLLNALIGQERVLTGPMAGVTRDAISVAWEHNGRPIRLIDTAGMRRRSKVTSKVEKLSAADSLHAAQFAQVVVIVLDGTMPLEKQDLHIAARVVEEGRAVVIAVNKWDLVRGKDEYLKDLEWRMNHVLPQIKGVPTVTLSAKLGKNLNKLWDAVFEIYDVWNKRVPTAKLNQWLDYVTSHHPPPLVNGRRLKAKYFTQVKTRPPTFVLFASKASELPESYVKYMMNSLREDFDLWGVPLRIMVKSGKNPYAKD